MSVLSRQLEKLFNAYHYPFQVIGSDQKILMVNRAFEKQLLGHEFVIGKDCCQGSETCRHKRFFETLEPYSDEFTIMLPNGQTISGRAQGAPIWANDDRILLGEAIVSIHKRPVESNSGLIGRSSVFNDLISRLEKAAKTQTPVLLLGETGTGKELAAEFIHQHSPRASHDFVVVDCTSISDELFESELFGHEKGAFTGAHSSKKGLFELSHQGTLFLDEIGELLLAQQAKLLRVLEKGQFRRVGGTKPLYSDIRIVSATHRNLARMVQQGSFREDLFYRLSVFPVSIAPLRERREDIPLLCQHFLRLLEEDDTLHYQLSRQALVKLVQYSWPGNIRELRNTIQLAAALCDNGMIGEADIQVQSWDSAVDVIDSVTGKESEISATLNPSPYTQLSTQAFQFASHLNTKDTVLNSLKANPNTFSTRITI